MCLPRECTNFTLDTSAVSAFARRRPPPCNPDAICTLLSMASTHSEQSYNVVVSYLANHFSHMAKKLYRDYGFEKTIDGLVKGPVEKVFECTPNVVLLQRGVAYTQFKEIAECVVASYIKNIVISIVVPPSEEFINALKPRPKYVPTVVVNGDDPPCMKAILEALKAGENIPHTARFAVTTYLLRRGWDIDRIVDLFKSVPDFNEKITRYQVQHIAGQVGGRKSYSVPNCETMNTWGLCPTNLGCGVKSPVYKVR